MKLLLVSPYKAPGVETALQNLKSITGAELKFIEEMLYFPPYFNLTPKLIWGLVRRGYFKFQRELMLFNLEPFRQFGNNIIFGGWGYPYNILTDKLNQIGIFPSVMWCSTIGQAEMTPTEIARFTELLQYLKAEKLKLLLLHRGLYETFNYINNVVFLPHTIDIQRIVGAVHELPLQDGLNADLFCSYRQGKNILTQILAGKLTKTHFTIHINFHGKVKGTCLPCDGEFLQVLQELNIKNVVIHPWFENSEYWNFLAGMDLSLQVTHTESFNYAVCERMILGIPPLTTYNIWLVSEDSYLKQHLCVDSPDTPLSIANKIDLILTNKTLHTELSERCKERIREIAQRDNSIALETINKYFK